jgi:hypothetical protein
MKELMNLEKAKLIAEMNIATIAQMLNIGLSDAKQVKHIAVLTVMKEQK